MEQNLNSMKQALQRVVDQLEQIQTPQGKFFLRFLNDLMYSIKFARCTCHREFIYLGHSGGNAGFYFHLINGFR